MYQHQENQKNIKYLPALIVSLVIFTGCNSGQDATEKTSQPLQQLGKHAASSDRLKIIMDNLYASAHESESSGQEQNISKDEMADLIEAVEELLFNAELMTSGTSEFGLDEKGEFISVKRALGFTEAEARHELATLAPHKTACGAVQVCGWGIIRTGRK